MHPAIDFISTFTEISEQEMRTIIGLLHTSSHKKNELIYRQGSIPKRASFIIKGAVRSFYNDENGNERNTAFYFENQPLIPFDSFAEQIPVSVNAITLEPTELIWTSHNEFFGFLESFPKYEKVLRNILSKYLSMQSEKMKIQRISSARDRYEMLNKMQPEIIKRVPLKYIASYLDMTLETLSRVRAAKL
ncbi:MAG TPA: Crp/Fnr family transcriptional regulator [Chitinophagales bacterium]|nr:Crp/Fnr family transcriptional regulator [Chitinophagales bacterium]